jgi:hypothetical protein
MDGGCGSGTVGSQAAALPWPWAQIVGKQPPAFGVALASGNPSRAVVRVSPTLQRKLRGHNLRSYYEFYAIFLGCIYIAKFAKGFCKHSLPYWRGV